MCAKYFPDLLASIATLSQIPIVCVYIWVCMSVCV